MGLAALRHGPSRCLGAEEAWASSSCPVLTLCVSDGVGLDWLPLGETFWSLLGGEGGRLQGLTHGPKALEAREAMGSFVFLCHAPDVTLSKEQLARACLGSNTKEPLAIGSLGLVFLCSGLG